MDADWTRSHTSKTLRSLIVFLAATLCLAVAGCGADQSSGQVEGTSGNPAVESPDPSAMALSALLADINAEAKLTTSDPALGETFGFSVAIDGDTAVVGSPSFNFHTGAAYVFVREGSEWRPQGELVRTTAAIDDEFGWSVAISEDTIVVGSPGEERNGSFADDGSVYVFVRDGTAWSQQAKLTVDRGADHSASLNFGDSVDISGDTVVVAEPGRTVEISTPGIPPVRRTAGAAYAFLRDGATWKQQAVLTPGDGVSEIRFAASIAVDGDTALVGAPSDPEVAQEAGAVFVFVRDGSAWNRQAKLTASDGRTSAAFGFSVAISTNTVLIGSVSYDEAAPNAGAAYVFVRSASSWSQQAKLTLNEPAELDLFGADVAVAGDTAVVSAQNGGFRGTEPGSVHVFMRSGSEWVEQASVASSVRYGRDEFGRSLAISGPTLLVGAPRDDGDAPPNAAFDFGAAYVFRLESLPVDQWAPRVSLTPDADDPGRVHGLAEDDRPSEDVNGNGFLDPGEDLDGDGLIDEDTGIAAVALEPGSINVNLNVDPFDTGDGTAAFAAALQNPALAGSGTVSVTDVAGNTTLTPVEIAAVLLRVALDIRPGSDANPVNLGSRGVIPVAILGSAEFDVTRIDVTTLAFGPGAAPPAHKAGGHNDDVNGDGIADLVVHFRTQAAGLAGDASEACVTAATLDGTPVEGCDAIRVVP